MVRAGVFVTLLRHGELRGCIGHIEADTPLAELTGRMAVSAAQHDPRFAPVRPDELPGITVELSVLGAPFGAAAEDLVPGRHGVIVTCGRRRGLMLPEVATQFGWDAEELLDAACQKALLPAGAWRHPGTVIELFTTQHLAARA
jgi:AmmeMemoRadiSam system protein A